MTIFHNRFILKQIVENPMEIKCVGRTFGSNIILCDTMKKRYSKAEFLKSIFFSKFAREWYSEVLTKDVAIKKWYHFIE